MELDEGTKYYLKPMNCPMHILIYRSRMRSYRELPLRLFEFGSVYRYEKSGVIHGLTRVRGLTMDDAHIFCAREQMMDELISLLDFTLGLLRDFGLTDFYLELSTRPEHKAVGTVEEWDVATNALRLAAEGRNLELVLDEGGGAFYGPKISVQARDAIGRTWQMSTIQVDFQFPQRFDLHFVDDTGAEQQPIMIHRALFGSIERFFGILLEHYAGHFPLWLAPGAVRDRPGPGRQRGGDGVHPQSRRGHARPRACARRSTNVMANACRRACAMRSSSAFPTWWSSASATSSAATAWCASATCAATCRRTSRPARSSIAWSPR